MTELCDEAITRFRQWLHYRPMLPHLPWCGIQSPTSGDGELHTPPQQTPPSEGTLHHLYAELGDLNDNEL